MALSLFQPFESFFRDPFFNDPFFRGWGLSPSDRTSSTSDGSAPSGAGTRAAGPLTNFFQSENVMSLGRCDIVETPTAHVLTLDTPGLTSGDVKVQVTDGNVLTISGQRRHENEEKTNKIHRVERSYGRFVRSFPLPPNTDSSKIVANMENGVLKVSVPKPPEPQPQITDIPIGSVGDQ